nr:hypothetical protein GCM10017611_31160 [Rhodococcus wratislaviensis]
MPAYTFGGLVAVHTFQHYSDELQGSGTLGEDPSSWGHDTSPNIMCPSSNRKEPLACDGNAHMSLPSGASRANSLPSVRAKTSRRRPRGQSVGRLRRSGRTENDLPRRGEPMGFSADSSRQ